MPFLTNNKSFVWVLVSDDERLADPAPLLGCLPPRSLVILRGKNSAALKHLAGRIIPLAHKLGHRVLLAGPIHLALKMKADGAHLSEARVKRMSINDLAPGLFGPLPHGFIISASAHDVKALARAKNIGANFAILGQAFNSQSHPQRNPIGPLRFKLMVRQSPVPVIAIGGVNKSNAKLLSTTGAQIIGFAGIEMFIDEI